MSFLEQLHLVVFPNKVISELSCLEFFLCEKMNDGMIKLNSMNFATWKRIVRLDKFQFLEKEQNRNFG